MRRFIILFLISNLILGFRVCGGYNIIKVVCTLEAYAGIVKLIGGDFVEVDYILPEGASPHEYSLTPEDREKVSNADIIVLVNSEFLELERRLRELFPSKTFVDFDDYNRYNLTILPAPGIEKNYHGYWLYPDNAVAIAHAIHDYLANMAPEYKDFFKRNLEKFIDDIEALKERMRNVAVEKDILNKGVLLAVPAVAYIAYSFGMVPKASILKAPGSLVSGSEIDYIERQIKNGDISIGLCPESFRDLKPGQVMDEIRRDTGLPIVYVRVFSLGGLKDYRSLLVYNIAVINSISFEDSDENSWSRLAIYLLIGFIFLAVVAVVESIIIFNFRKRAEEILYE